MTKNEKLEYIKCSNDILYFIERYCVKRNSEGVNNVYLRSLKLKIINDPNNILLKDEIYKIYEVI